jgi:NAD(P)H-hydrate epimerase
MPFLVRVVGNQEMRALDEKAQREYHLDQQVLMENAGQTAARLLLEKYPHAGRTTEILVFAGKGNNAGDAFVVARHLLCLERKVRVFHLESHERLEGASKRNFEILKAMKAKIAFLETASELSAFFESASGPFTVVDGILGTGLKGNLEGVFRDVVETINGLHASEVISLDMPSGVNGDSGAIHGTSIHADLTISFGFPKLGHFLPPGAARRGQLVNVDISLPPQFHKTGDKFLLTRGPMSALIKHRDRYGHKNSFGHALLIGGSFGRLGAIVMAAGACHRMGTGLVTVGAWEDVFAPLMTKLPNETMMIPLKTELNLAPYSSVVIGPGLGLRSDGKVLLEEILASYNGPVVLDADALTLVVEHKFYDLLRQRRAPCVLTPHPGEMARLLGVSKEAVTDNPIAAVREAVNRTHCIVVLKGAATVVGSTDDVMYLNHYPNDGMATAGSGDVLAGMIGGLLGQGMDPFQGAQLGVYLHSLAGDLAANQLGHRGMTAPDIIGKISYAFQELKKSSSEANRMESDTWLL